MDAAELIRNSEPFLRHTAAWHAALPELALAGLAAAPERTAILSVDMINGFCYTGSLASPRVQAIINPIVSLFERAHAAGLRQMVLVQEDHEPDAVEFNAYPAHGVHGTHEAESVPELKALPFYAGLPIITKNSIHPALNTRLEDWLSSHPEVDTFVAVGDCTDLCLYQTAMHLRLRANARQLQQRVIVPANCAATFDLPVPVAEQIKAIPHDGDLLQLIFLYSLHLNGVEVVRAIG